MHWRQYGKDADTINRRAVRCHKKIARRRNISTAELIRQAVDNMIKSTVLVDIEEMRKRAVEAAGRFSSNLGDLFTEHDKYLDEAFGS